MRSNNMPDNNFRKPRGRRIQTVDRVNLSQHVLKVNLRKHNRRFNFDEIEDYVRAIAGGREYQYEAIRDVMTYLWGGGYKNVADLAKENYANNPHLQERFGSEELMLGHLPLADRLSGVVHMATGTGKSYVIFAVAYLSLVMGFTKRVLVLGPSSLIVKQGLREKFENFMNRDDWNKLLPREYQGKAIELLKNSDVIGDNSITIENINAIYRDGGIRDTLFKGIDEVLVLGDEIHHAYSHLKFNAVQKELELDQDVDPTKGKESDERSERLWMKFLRQYPEITRHVGFTGTPYNANDYFADVLFDYNIRVAINEKYIKDINPIIGTESDQGDVQWTPEKRFAVIYQNHLDNSEKYAYAKNDIRRVKPITVFYCPAIVSAKAKTEEFINFLIRWERENKRPELTDAELDQMVRPKVLCVVSGISDSDKNKLDNVEETDLLKVGGAVEFIFSVGKLLEGWDVDNVFQIVPMEEKLFNSKLLISQVLGRGLRIPRCLDNKSAFDQGQIKENYPMLTVTNHEKFGDQIKELIDAVTNSDMFIVSEPLPLKDEPDWRGKHHFSLFNLNYLSGEKFEDAPPQPEQIQGRKLILDKIDLKENLTIFYDKGSEKYQLKKQTVTLDSIVDGLYRRFKGREYEEVHFDFGNGEESRCPTEEEIRNTIIIAMEEAGIEKNGLADDNKKQIDLYFNQFLPKGTKIRIPVNIAGNITPISTQKIERSSIRVGELERDATALMSQDYEQEVDEKTKTLIKYVRDNRKKSPSTGQLMLGFTDPNHLLVKYQGNIKSLTEGDPRPPYIVDSSLLKNPQSVVLVSHYPEKEFVFRLIGNSEYIESWIKSPDKGFYSVEYEYWKGGKDRVLRGFNPDFFIKINLDNYLKILKQKGIKDGLDVLKKLQDDGIESIIRVVEIKSDEDEDEATPAKAEKAKIHFSTLNKKLIETNPVNISEEFKRDLKQHYTFDLLKPAGFSAWFSKLINGNL